MAAAADQLSLYLPSCWNDDERMSELLSAFKSRNLNPASYDAKMSFWVEAVEASCRRLRNPLVSSQQLKARFRRNSQLPAGMADVVRQMVAVGKLVPVQRFQNRSQGWLAWGIDKLVKVPYAYLFGGSGKPQDKVGESYVLVDVLEEISNKVMDQRRTANMSNPLYADLVSLRVLQNAARPFCPNEEVFDLVIQDLVYRKQLTVGVSEQGDKIVKFRTKNEAGPVKITDVDRTVHNMKAVVEKLEQEMMILEEQANSLEDQAREQIQKKNRMKAKSFLRQRQMIMKRLQERETAYSNMLTLIDRLTQSDDNKVIFDTYKASLAALKSNMEAHGFASADKVNETLEDIHEMLDVSKEISTALDQLGPTSPAADSELEDELNSLIAEADSLQPAPATPQVAFPKVPSEPLEEMDEITARLTRLRERV